MQTDIATAMNNYNKNHNCNFALVDSLVLGIVRSNTYTTDTELAEQLLCSERTIKRSINKLCSFGLIKKHLSYDNTKTLSLQEDALKHFIQEGATNG